MSAKAKHKELKRAVRDMEAKRNNDKCQNALNQITKAAKTNTGNLLELSINAVKERATIGEISLALEMKNAPFETNMDDRS